MNIMLGDLVDIYILVYSDDILIYLAIAADYTGYISAVFELLAKSKYYLKCKKYTFFLPKVDFFGHVVSERRVWVSPGKVSAV